jgi:hypothetical protein
MKKTPFFLPFLLLLFSCSGDDAETIIEDPVEPNLLEVTSDVISYEFTPDTGNNTNRLTYEIKFINPNDIAILGFPRVTLNIDGTVSTRIVSSGSPCTEIAADSYCSLNFDEEESLNVAVINSIELVRVEYVITL